MIFLLTFGLVIVEAVDDVPLCGTGIFELLETSTGFPTLPQKRDHLVELPQEGNYINITALENGTALMPAVRCSLRIKTCPSCILNIKHRPPSDFFSERELPTCYESLLDPCFDLQFVEDKADTTLDLIYRKSSIWEFPQRSEWNSTGDSMVLMLTMWNVDQNSTLKQFIDSLFPFVVTSVSNEVLVVGSPADNILAPNQTSIGFIESPRYPEAYPRSLVKRYVLVNSHTNGYVRLVFDDFHVHFQSEMQIFDSDGHLLANTKNDNRRPPAILSNGSRLTIQFKAHDFTQTVGFRARYEFVDDPQWPDKPNSRVCDETLEAYGGEIKLDGSHHLINTFVDCIWIVGRVPHVTRTFDRMYLKVEEFHMKGIGLRLEIREGASSTSERLLLLFDSQARDQLQHKQPRHGFTTSSTSPVFYVRLRGYLMGTSGLEIVYAQFYRWATALCPGIGEFHCDNSRCIKATLRCDNIDHCGDDSDEQCQRPISDFKQPDSDVSGLVALVIGVCGLILLTISTTAVLGRFYRRRVSSLSSGTDISAAPFHSDTSAVPSMQTVGERRFYVVPESQISVIEAPPSYDDALKHPAVQSSRASAYMNQAYTSSTSDERVGQSSTSGLTTIPESASESTISNLPVGDEQNETASEARNTTPSPSVETVHNEESSSGLSPNPHRQDDESWV